MHCRIRINWYLDPSWQERLGNLEIIHEAEGTSLLIGQVPDQAALYGVLLTIRRLGLSLLSLETSEASGMKSRIDTRQRSSNEDRFHPRSEAYFLSDEQANHIDENRRKQKKKEL